MKFIKCDICQGNEIEFIFTGRDLFFDSPKEYKLVKCKNCGLIFLNPQPEEDEIKNFYSAQYSEITQRYSFFADIFINIRLFYTVGFLKKLIGENGRILEVGCGNGRDLIFLKKFGNWELTGIEPDNSGREALREKGITIYNKRVEEISLPPEYFDIIIMKHVLEHLTSPSAILNKINNSLKKGGYLMLSLPNEKGLERKFFGKFWSGFEIPRHLFTFNIETINKLLFKNNFSIENLEYSNVPNDWILSINFFLKSKNAPTVIVNFFSIRNILLLVIFTPMVLLQKLFKNSSRVTVLAKKN